MKPFTLLSELSKTDQNYLPGGFETAYCYSNHGRVYCSKSTITVVNPLFQNHLGVFLLVLKSSGDKVDGFRFGVVG
jgi:hypothetical protein